MKANRRKRLEVAGWKVGSAKEFLELSDEEAAFVELKFTLSASLKKCRTSHGLSQSELAKRLRSSQSRVAKMEASDPAVSVDLLIRALFAAGRKEEGHRQSNCEERIACSVSLDARATFLLYEDYSGLARIRGAERD